MMNSLNDMKRAEHIQSELNDLGAVILKNLASRMPYAVPNDYFSTLADEITDLTKITEQSDPQLLWGNQLPFDAPGAGYFEGLAAQVLAKVNTAVPEFSSQNPYTVPQGYFETLPEIIVAKAKVQSPVKKRVPLFRTARLAASMALIIIAGFGVLQMNNKKQNQFNLSSVSKAEIDQYVTANLDDFDTDLIINGLANTKTDKKIELSNSEIRAYLDETGWN